MSVLARSSGSFFLALLGLLAVFALSGPALTTLAEADEERHAKDPFGGGEERRAEDPFGGGFGGEFGGESRRGEFGGRGGLGRGGFGQAEAVPTPNSNAASKAAVGDPHRQLVLWADTRSESSEKIRRALSSPLSSVGLDFADIPLIEVVDFLRAEYEIEIQIDTAALDDLGIAIDELIAVNLRNISLRSALKLMLQQLELTTIITDEVLLITTEEEAESRLSVAVYPVGDLTDRGKTASHLTQALIDTVAYETWAENGGGEAEVRSLPGGLLVISQTRSVHEEIANVLTAIRKAKHANH